MQTQLTAQSAGLVQCGDCHKLLNYLATEQAERLICPRCGDVIECRKCPGQRLRSTGADMQNSHPKNEPPKILLPAGVESADPNE